MQRLTYKVHHTNHHPAHNGKSGYFWIISTGTVEIAESPKLYASERRCELAAEAAIKEHRNDA